LARPTPELSTRRNWPAAPNRTSTVSNPTQILKAPFVGPAAAGPFWSRAPSISLPISAATTRTRAMASVGERLTVFAFAAFVVLAIVGIAFAAGYLIGRIFL